MPVGVASFSLATALSISILGGVFASSPVRMPAKIRPTIFRAWQIQLYATSLPQPWQVLNDSYALQAHPNNAP